MKKLTLAIIAMVTALCSFAAEDEQPIITFKPNIYDTYGASNSFTIRLGSKEKAWFDYDCGAGKNEVEVEPATFDTEASAIIATLTQRTQAPRPFEIRQALGHLPHRQYIHP